MVQDSKEAATRKQYKSVPDALMELKPIDFPWHEANRVEDTTKFHKALGPGTQNCGDIMPHQYNAPPHQQKARHMEASLIEP